MKIIPIILAFLAGIFLDFFKNVILSTIHEKRDKYVFSSLITGFKGFTDHSRLYSVGPLVTDCIVWKGMAKRNQRGFKRGEINFSFTDYQKDRSADFNAYIQGNWDEQTKQNPNLRNEVRCGVRSMRLDPDVNITFYETNYKNFIGTNQSISDNRFAEFITETERKISSLKDGYRLLAESNFSNDLATATTVITKDGYVLLSKRSQEVFVLKNLIHTSIAEGMQLDSDWNDSINAPDPFKTIARGAKEELNLDIDVSEIEITSFGLYRPFMQPFITGKIMIDQTYSEVIAKLAEHDNTFEGNVFAVKYNLTNLSPFLFDRKFLGQNLEMAELGKISILQCLIQKHGQTRLHKGLINTYKVVEKYF